MAKDTTKDVARKEVEKIAKKAQINEAYLVGLLWADPYSNFTEYADTIKMEEFYHDVWEFYFELGRKMFKDGVKTFDDITVHTKVKEYNVEEHFAEYGKMDTIEDAIGIVKESSDNIEYYVESLKRNDTIKRLYSLFGEKVLIKKNRYNYENMNREELTIYWQDKMNQIGMNNIKNYEAENLYIEADEFFKNLEEDSAEMLPFYDSYHMNSITQGVPRGAVTMVAGFGNSGKALSLDTAIPTPEGWSTMGDLEIGDMVFGGDGKPTKIVCKSPVFKNHNVYEVVFEDGEKILADAEHQWGVRTDYSVRLIKQGINKIKGKNIDDKGLFVVTTEDMIEDFVRSRPDKKGVAYKYRVPMQEPVHYEEKNLLIKPYTFGVWLGDGTSSSGNITVGEKDLNNIKLNLFEDGYDVSVRENKEGAYTLLLKNPYKETHCERGHEKDSHWNMENKRCRECDRVRHSSKEDISEINPKYYGSIQQQLRKLNVLNNKFIPREYLQSSIEQRFELLKGLMDTDGYVSEDGYCEFAQKNKPIVDGFSELLSSLGIKHSIKLRTTNCQGKSFESYRVSFHADKKSSCFKLDRKHRKLADNLSSRRKYKSIVEIRKVDTVPTQCIMVDNDSHLYLAGKRMTVTHNSSLVAEKFVMSCISNKEKLIIVLNEEDAQSFRQKIVLSIMFHEHKTGIDRKRMVNGKLQDNDRQKIRKAFERMHELMDGDEAQIKVIYMDRYIMKDLEKIVRFWANRGYKNLMIDTHKVSDNSAQEKRWESFVEDAKTIYRFTRKNAGGLNLRTILTCQLADSAIRNRFLTFDALSEGKSAKNEMAIVMMFRNIFTDEYKGGKKELRCFRYKKGEDGEYHKEDFLLEDVSKTYYLLFAPKNRTGANTDNGQAVLVMEVNFNMNNFKEIGWCYVPKDYS